jgi:hypothetical protein
MVEHLSGGWFLMYFQWLNFIICFPAFLDSYYCFYRLFSHFERKMHSKTHIKPYLPFVITEIPQRWIIFMFCQWIRFVPRFLTVFALIMVSTCFSVIWRKNTHKNTDWAICSLPNNKHTWEMDHYWCTSNDCLCVLFPGSFGQLIWFLQARLSVGRTKSPHSFW